MTLFHNLNQIHDVISRLDCDGFPLVASQGTLYSAESYKGSFYSLWSDDAAVRKALDETVRDLHETFQQKVQPALAAYKEFLTNQSLGLEVDERVVHPIRSKLQDWQKATFPLLNVMQVPRGRAKVFLNNYFKENPFIMPVWKEWIRYQTIMKLECLSCSPLPMHDLMILSHSHQKPSEVFRAWVKQFDEVGAGRCQGAIHDGLKASVEHIQEVFHGQDRRFDSIHLESMIWHHGFGDMLCSADSDHLAWREQLSIGDQLGDYTLKKQLGKKLHKEDKKWVFEIEEREDVVLVVAQNRAVLHMRNYVSNHFDRDAVMVYETIDPEGRFALIEKLTDSAEGYPWEKVVSLNSNEKEMLQDRILLAQEFLQNDITPKISLTLFRRNSDGVFKGLKPFRWEEFNFNHIEEDLIYGTSKGNFEVYQYLAKKSQIDRHPYALFYGEVIRFAAFCEKKDIAMEGAHRKIEDGTIIKRAENLYKEVTTLVEEVHSELCNLEEPPNGDVIAQVVTEEYQRWHMVGRILDGFKSLVVQRLSQGAP